MEETLLSALVQAPFVLAMAYLVQRFLLHLDSRDDEWRKFTVEENNRLVDQLDRQSRAIESLTVLMIRHDAAVHGKDPGATQELIEQLKNNSY